MMTPTPYGVRLTLGFLVAAMPTLAPTRLALAQPTRAQPAASEPQSPQPSAQGTGTPSEPIAPPQPPPYNQLRYEENYSYLCDPSRRTDRLDALKYVPLNPAGDRYLSFGLEAREYYERFRNPDFSARNQDSNGYFLQRYALHSDLHLGRRLRVFGQLLSALENGRRGGPRPIDEDKLGLHQGFLDLNFGTRTGGQGATGREMPAFVVRLGREEVAFGSGRMVARREGPSTLR